MDEAADEAATDEAATDETATDETATDETRDDARDETASSGVAPASGSRGDDEPSALHSRLRVIEDQPLEMRAESLAQVHDELRAQLEAGDAARSHA